jgi:hypothetical protein
VEARVAELPVELLVLAVMAVEALAVRMPQALQEQQTLVAVVALETTIQPVAQAARV